MAKQLTVGTRTHLQLLAVIKTEVAVLRRLARSYDAALDGGNAADVARIERDLDCQNALVAGLNDRHGRAYGVQFNIATLPVNDTANLLDLMA